MAVSKDKDLFDCESAATAEWTLCGLLFLFLAFVLWLPTYDYSGVAAWRSLTLAFMFFNISLVIFVANTWTGRNVAVKQCLWVAETYQLGLSYSQIHDLCWQFTGHAVFVEFKKILEEKNSALILPYWFESSDDDGDSCRWLVKYIWTWVTSQQPVPGDSTANRQPVNQTS